MNRLLRIFILIVTTGGLGLASHARGDATHPTPAAAAAPDLSGPSSPASNGAVAAPFYSVARPASPTDSPSSTPNPADDIYDLRPPIAIFSWTPWIVGAAAGLVVLALAIGIWLGVRRLRVVPVRTAYELTLEKLDQARAMLDPQEPLPYTLLVSETLREYLGHRFQAPSSRRTTEEFLQLMDRNPAAPLAAHRDLLRHFLEACDLVKFARYQPTLEELEEVHDRAVSFVTATRPMPAATKAREEEAAA